MVAYVILTLAELPPVQLHRPLNRAYRRRGPLKPFGFGPSAFEILRGNLDDRGELVGRPAARGDVMPGVKRAGWLNGHARGSDVGEGEPSRCRVATQAGRGLSYPRARVAEWQTQRTQNPPGATPCEFDSRLGHP